MILYQPCPYITSLGWRADGIRDLWCDIRWYIFKLNAGTSIKCEYQLFYSFIQILISLTLKYTCVEPYVDTFYTRNVRSLLAQFILCILPLHIETGSYINLSVEERQFNVCKNGDVQDEIHFLCTNILYDIVRSHIVNFDNLNDHEIKYYLQKHNQKY